MYHRIADFCDVVQVMASKARELHTEKYIAENPNQAKIEFLIADIKYMALTIANDNGQYKRIENG